MSTNQIVKNQSIFSINNGMILNSTTNRDQSILLLKRHRLIPLVNYYLNQLDDQTKQYWKKHLSDWAAVSFQHFNVLKEVTEKIQSCGIELIHLKGPVLSFTIHNDISSRQYRDLDILISRNKVIEVTQILTELGFEVKYPKMDLRSKWLDFYFKHRKEIGFENKKQKISLELHTGIDSNGILSKASESMILFDSVDVEIYGTLFKTMNKHNTFLYLVFHGAWHQFFRLFWLKDIADVLNQWNLDHRQILHRAEMMGIQRMLGVSLLLAHEFFTIEIPEEYMNYINSENRILQKMKGLCYHYISGPEKPLINVRFERLFYFLLLKRSMRHRIMTIVELAHRFFIRILFDR